MADFGQCDNAVFLKFVNELGVSLLPLFLCYCTGLKIVHKEITVDFKGTKEEHKMPTVHTCGRVLHLKSTFVNYADFRLVFMNVSCSHYLEMGLV